MLFVSVAIIMYAVATAIVNIIILLLLSGLSVVVYVCSPSRLWLSIWSNETGLQSRGVPVPSIQPIDCPSSI